MSGSGPPTAHDMLFVAGVARSGTTVLRRVLGTHPDVAVGMERYKRLWGREIDRLGPALFERERFFDFSDGLTNITPDLPWARERMADLEAKWDTARYHGDKMTTIRATRLWRTFPDARFVFIVRDIAQVASSWQRRAGDGTDAGWRRDMDATAAVEAWNTATRRVARAVEQRPGHAVVLDYARFFGNPRATGLRAVAAFLDLDPAPVLPVWRGAHEQYVGSVAGRDRTLPPDVARHLAEHTDHDAWARVTALAL